MRFDEGFFRKKEKGVELQEKYTKKRELRWYLPRHTRGWAGGLADVDIVKNPGQPRKSLGVKRKNLMNRVGGEFFGKRENGIQREKFGRWLLFKGVKIFGNRKKNP